MRFWGTLGFSYTGFIFLCCMFLFNIIYALRRPKDYVKYEENKILLCFERAGQVLCTTLILIFRDFNFRSPAADAGWYFLAWACMAVYLICWLRYFAGGRKESDFYRDFLRIPVPLASMPIAAFFFLAVYGNVMSLMISAVIIGIGHIGIILSNRRKWRKSAGL